MAGIVIVSVICLLLLLGAAQPCCCFAVHGNKGGHNVRTVLRSHTLAILTLPQSSADRIANDAILESAMSHTDHRLSVVLRCKDSFQPTLAQLRGYVGEIYSSAWDYAIEAPQRQQQRHNRFLDVIVYPHNLPNAAPEQWIHHRPDLTFVCSHDSIIGWTSSGAAGTGISHLDVSGEGTGGLEAHVEAINQDRVARGLGSVVPLHVENWPVGANEENSVSFLEDEEFLSREQQESNDGLLGYRIPSTSLYNSVAVGGTFDGMHYGHRKLLTLAVSSVQPSGGKLLIGITTDEMLRSKTLAELIPPLNERIRDVRKFIDRLAPGIKNRVKIVPIREKYGPPGAMSGIYKGVLNDFDALVLSHETLLTGIRLNEHRVQRLKLPPLKLLCTRRTEPHAMSSTALRRLKKGMNAITKIL